MLTREDRRRLLQVRGTAYRGGEGQAQLRWAQLICSFLMEGD